MRNFQRYFASEAIINSQDGPFTQEYTDFSSPKKYFQVKRRSFLQNLTPENLMLSQLSHIKQKIQNRQKKLKRAKIAH